MKTMRCNVSFAWKMWAALLYACVMTTAQSQALITAIGTPYTQNFDSLPSAATITWANNSTITGWYHQRTGAGATIVPGTGSSATGALYSFGAVGSAERALGAVSSVGTGGVFYGVRLLNQTGVTITSLRVSYAGEQWRRAATAAPAAQTVAFSYVTGSPITGSLVEFQAAGTAVAALDLVSPVTALPTGALDGNLAANRVAVSATITGLSIPNNSEILLRWSDPDHPDNDHGLAIDDFSVVAGSATNLTLSVTDAPDPVTAGSNITYTIDATNVGPNNAPNAIVSTAVPSNTSFVSITAPAGWSCTTPAVGASGAVSCSRPSFATGTTAQLILVVAVAPGAAGSTNVPAAFALTSDLTETVPGDESANLNTLVNALNLTVTPSASANGTISPTSPQSVLYNATTSFTVTPSAGFTTSVGGSCGGALVGTTYTTNAVLSDCTVIASFTPIVYSVTPSAGANGSISPTTVQSVNSGATATFTVTPNAGFTANVGGTCGGALVGTIYTTSAVTNNCTVSASFTPIAYSVTPSAGANGSISPATVQSVNSGATTTFTVTPNAGFTANVGGTCGGALVGTTYTTNAVTNNCTVIASFVPIVYSVTPSAGANGSISPTTVQPVNSGSTTTLAVTPNAGFTAIVGGTCGGALVGTTYTTSAVTNNCTVSASFAPIVYSVTPSAGVNGSISPTTLQPVNSGATTTFTITPDAGFFSSVAGTCGGALVGNTYTTNPVTNNCTVIASFAPIVYAVTPSAGANGSISPTTSQSVNSGATTGFTVTPNAGFTANVGGTCGGALVGTTYTTNAVTNNCTVIASFVAIVYSVTPSASANGTISPSTNQSVNSGATTSFTVTPNTGFTASVGGTCGGALVGIMYTTDAVTNNCTVSASFTPIVYSVTPSAGANGSISPTTVQSVNSGATTTLTVTPTTGFTATVAGSCGGVLVGTTYTTNAVTNNCTVSASFVPIVYFVTPSAGANGTISPTTNQSVNSGATTSFTVTPNAGFTANVGGTCGGALVGTTYTTIAVTNNCTVSASFTPIVYSVTPSAGANGSISPATVQSVNSGATTVFTITPNAGFTVVVGGSCGGALVGNSYTTNASTSNCTVVADFAFAELIPQTITNFAPPSVLSPAIGGSFTLSATGGASGNPVTFSSSSPTVCTVVGNVVNVVGYGTCTLQALQAGNAQYRAASAEVSVTLRAPDQPQATPVPTLRAWATLLLITMVGFVVGARRREQ
jgi:Domain of unknown function DUF11/Divergent InlB B-repeat domain